MSLSARDLLALWERGIDAAPYRKALLLLTTAHPDESFEQLGQLSIGQRDARLMAWRALLFGEQVEAIAGCPVCGETSELAFRLSDLCSVPAVGESVIFEAEGYAARFRLPNSHDLDAIAARPEKARMQLLARCLLSLSRDGRECGLAELPESITREAVCRMSEADPLADIQLALVCSSCGHGWSTPFDIVAFLWREIESLAATLFREVHLLARAYHWREEDILAMSPLRRRRYLEMITA